MTADFFFISPMISTKEKSNTIPIAWAIDTWIWKRLIEKLIVFSLTVDSVNTKVQLTRISHTQYDELQKFSYDK